MSLIEDIIIKDFKQGQPIQQIQTQTLNGGITIHHNKIDVNKGRVNVENNKVKRTVVASSLVFMMVTNPISANSMIKLQPQVSKMTSSAPLFENTDVSINVHNTGNDSYYSNEDNMRIDAMKNDKKKSISVKLKVKNVGHKQTAMIQDDLYEEDIILDSRPTNKVIKKVKVKVKVLNTENKQLI